MNRNLKRVLSLALTLVVMAGTFMIPAMAATTITVSYTDLLSNTLTGKQGELFYETSPGTNTPSTGVDTGDFNRAYAPLEVPTGGNQANALTMTASEWVRFTVTAETAGYYAVNMTARRPATAGADVIVRTDSSIIEKHLARATTFAATGNIGYLYLAEGTNYVYVDNKSPAAQVNFRSMTLTLDESADVTQVDLLAPIATATEIADLTVAFNDGYNQADVSNATLTFPVSIAEDGKYQVSVMGKAGGSNTVSASFGDDSKEATVANDAYGYTTIGVFPLTVDDYTLTLDGFTDYSLAWAKIEYVGSYMTEMTTESITDGDTVSRGTDSYVIEFNDVIDAVDADTQITLESADDTIATVAAVDGKELTVSFKETLDYETPYTLTLTGLKGVYDENTMENHVVTFTTADDSNTEGTATVEVTDVTSSREDGTVTGVVKGSTGVGIKGRTVTVFDSTSGEVATGVSGDDGLFEIAFTITETAAGAYNYTVTSEYGASATAVVSYVSELEELRILGLFLGATTPEAVYGIFEDYGEVLLVPTYEADCDSLANDDLFLGHFQGKAFTAVSEVAPFYNKMLKMEGMNQATTGSYIKSNYLTQPAVCELLGIASDKLDLVTLNDPGDSKKTSFADKIAADTRTNGASTSEAAFVTRIKTLLDAWLLEQNNITPTSLDLTGATTSAYYAGEIAIPLNFMDEQTKVKAIEVVVTTADDNLLTNAEAVVEDAISSEVVIDRDANTATFTIEFEYDATKAYDDLGKISLQASVIATHDIDVDATVIYRFTTQTTDADGNPVDINVDMPIAVTGGNIRASVFQTPSESVRPSTGNTGYVAPPKEPEKDEDDDANKSAYFFDDMKEALWAQDMVHALVGKGIISKNDERQFRPMDNITREEVVKMLVTVVGTHKTDAVSNLSDVGADHWATSYIATAQELGIIQGNPDGTFGLGNQITRQDLSVMIFRTFKLLGIDLAAGDSEFTDAGNIANYAKDAISALEKLGILNGMGDGTFAPTANATRAQAAKVIYVMMEVLGV